MKKQILLLTLACSLMACERPTSPSEQHVIPVNDVSNDKVSAPEQAVKDAAAEQPTTDMPQANTLDLNLRKGDLILGDAPAVTRKTVLPNLFETKKHEKKRLSVGGKLLLDDQPNVELRESVQGAQMSIQVSTP